MSGIKWTKSAEDAWAKDYELTLGRPMNELERCDFNAGFWRAHKQRMEFIPLTEEGKTNG